MIAINILCAILFFMGALTLIAGVSSFGMAKNRGMARIVLGSLINDIRNAIGSLVYSSWKGVHYVRQKASTIYNPNSSDQSNMRARIAAAAKRWFNTLTENQRGTWEEYAQNLGSASSGDSAQEGGSKVVIPANRGIMSGFNAYCMINCVAYSAGVMALGVYQDDIPAAEAPNAPTNLACVWNPTTDCNIGLTWTDPDAPPALTDGMIRVWATSVNAGVHKQLVATVAVAAETYDIENVKVAHGLQVTVKSVPGVYYVQIDFVDQFGQRSAPSNVCTVTVPAGCVTGP